jgi:hypothetical protein
MSEFDVQFARPMIQHHSMAIEMARAYNRNPDGGSWSEDASARPVRRFVTVAVTSSIVPQAHWYSKPVPCVT